LDCGEVALGGAFPCVAGEDATVSRLGVAAPAFGVARQDVEAGAYFLRVGRVDEDAVLFVALAQ
jgi:hypothetical protein